MKKYFIIVFQLLVFLTCISTKAVALPIGWSTSTLSNGWILVNDTTNNIQWLSPFYSTSISYNAMLSYLSDQGSPYYGFDYASNEQINSLFFSYGATVSQYNEYRPENLIPATEFISDFNFTDVGINKMLKGLSAPEGFNYYVPYVAISWFDDPNHDSMGSFVMEGVSTIPSQANSIYGSWLIINNSSGNTPSPSPVPEPTTILLYGTGIAGLAGTRLRRKK